MTGANDKDGSNWDLVPLRSVTVDVRSWDPSLQPDDEFAYVDISAIDNRSCEIVNSKRLLGREAPSRARRPIIDGDVLFSNVRTYLRNVAQVSGLRQPAVASTGFTLLRPTAAISSRYLFHLVRSDFFISRVTPEQTGTHYPATSDRVVRDQLIPLPNRSVQDQLAQLIDSIESKRASSNERLAAAKQVIERFRRAVLAAGCSGRLTADWRDAHPRLEQSADELLRELQSPRGKDLDPETSSDALPDLPETWRVATGAEAFVFVTSGSRGWAKYYSDEGPAFLRVGNLDRHRLDLDLTAVQAVTPPPGAESRRTSVQPGDLLISITAEVGMVGVAPSHLGEAYVNQHVAIARPHPQLNERFLAAFVAAPSYGEAQLDALQRGATKAGIGLDDIRALSIPLPSPEEQIEIARRVDQLMSIADCLDSRIDAASLRIDRCSQAVLAKAFRGDLVVNDDDLTTAEGLPP